MNQELQALGLLSIENIYELLYALDLDDVTNISKEIKKILSGPIKNISKIEDLQLGQLLIFFDKRELLEKNISEINNLLKEFIFNYKNKVFINFNIAFLDIDEKSEFSNFENCISILKLCLNKITKNQYKNTLIWKTSLFNKNHIKQKLLRGNFINSILYQNKLKFAFQPIIDAKNGNTSYHECLLRIINDNGQVLSIGPYIAIAEQYKLISAIDYKVLDMAISELEKNPDIHLSFNVSTVSIYDNKWLEYALHRLQKSSINERIIIELTETSLQKDLGKVSYFVACLQNIGCKVAIDDFGAGYTSFRQLKAIPVDIVKIDGAFIKDIVSNYENKVFVQSLLNITKSFGVKSVAEFVENGEIAKVLIDLEVDYMQGNYFGEAAINRRWNTN